MNTNELNRIADFFRSAEGPVRWTGDGLWDERPFADGRTIDVYVPDICKDLGLNWLVTISTRREEGEDDVIVLAPSSSLTMTWNEGKMNGPPDNATVTFDDWTVDYKFEAQPENQPFGDWELFHEKVRTITEDGALVVTSDVYSVPEVNRALSAWAKKIGAGEVQFDMAVPSTPFEGPE